MATIVLLLFMMNIYMNAEVNVQMSVDNFNLLKLFFCNRMISVLRQVHVQMGRGGVNVDAD